MAQLLADMRYGADPLQRLDLYLPDHHSGHHSNPGARLFLFVHGGGWRGGDKAEYRPLAEVLVGFGYAVALPNHRLAPTAVHPAPIEDVAAALGFILRDAGESGIRREGICLAGHSSGGHLASLLALHPRFLDQQSIAVAQIAGVVSISGVYDLTRYDGLAGDYLTMAFGSDPAQQRDASPMFHAPASPPPFFLAYAEFDYPGADDQARRMAAALKEAGGDARVLRVAGRDHASILTGARSLLDPLAVNLALFLRSLR